jgi:competence/damage-inducible protein CinA-like protein
VPTAEILIIGNEILLGDVVDTNSGYLAQSLRELGVEVVGVQTVPDDRDRIAQAVRDGVSRADLVVAAGGLGPTGDDVTREAVADALGVGLEYRPELWQQVLERFKAYGATPTDNNRRQAYVPSGSKALANPVGTAPCFASEVGGAAIVALPGVPNELQHMMHAEVRPYLVDRFGGESTTAVRVVHTAGIGESQLDDLIGDLEASLNPKVGLAAHPGQVDVRVTATASDTVAAIRMLDSMEGAIRSRLGRRVFGVDGETLAGAALLAAAKCCQRLVVAESCLGGSLVGPLSAAGPPFVHGAVLAECSEPDSLSRSVAEIMGVHDADCGVGAAVTVDTGEAAAAVEAAANAASGRSQTIVVHLSGPFGALTRQHKHGGHPAAAPTRAANLAMDLLRTACAPDR